MPLLMCLAGADVARKVVILARECGLQLAGTPDLQVASLVPPQLEIGKVAVQDFLQQLPQVRAVVGRGLCCRRLCCVPAHLPRAAW